MTGTIRERGDNTWLLRWYDYETKDERRVRVQRYKTVKGTKKQAKEALALVTASKVQGNYVAPSEATVAKVADEWLANEATQTRAKTQERYGQLVAKQIKPRLGALLVQELTELKLEDFYRGLAKNGGHKGRPLAKRTVQHVHRVLHAILKRAAKAKLVPSNVAASAEAPKGPGEKAESFNEAELPKVLAAFKGRPLCRLVALAFDTGLRRSELCALRWSDIDLDAATLEVDESLSQTAEGKIFEKPKTDTSKRTISLTDRSVADLRALWKERTEQRLKLGLGKLPADRLVFPGDDDQPRCPDAVTRGFARVVDKLDGVRPLPFHSTRHTHASILIAAGVDVVTISRRLGHSSPAVTLKIYAHMFNAQADKKAAGAINTALAR